MGMAPLPPPPPELNADITSEILLRVDPDDPVRHFRASLVCKLWHNILSDPHFRRRYRDFHRLPSLHGFFYNPEDFPQPFSGIGFDFPAPYSRFVATTASPLSQAAAAHDDDDRRVSWALDCRHGRVLFQKAGSSRGLAVWDPIADDWTDLPPPSIQFTSCSAAVLCDVAGCDHHDCRGGHFLVVCIGRESTRAYACVYSSEDRAWQAPVSDGTGYRGFDMTSRSVLIGDGIYCIVDGGYYIVMYDLVERRFSWIGMPLPCWYRWDPVLMQNEDGSLGLAGVRGSRLHLWSRRQRNNPEEGDAVGARWVQQRVIELRKLLPADNKQCIDANVIGFAAEAVGVLFLRTNAGVFTLELKTRQVIKMNKPSKIYHSVVPFVSYFTPDRAS